MDDFPTWHKIRGTSLGTSEGAVLFRGPSGSGKSDLALRCLMSPEKNFLNGPLGLVGDDYVEISKQGDQIIVRSIDTIQGLLEVRGLGVQTMPVVLKQTRLKFIADLVSEEKIDRFPDPLPRDALLGVLLPVIKLRPFEASSCAKVILSLSRGGV